ncbi:MAG: adenosylmethionine-8-amino-7-oxononanoate aminotransferase, partial [Pirellulaceae bacterium]
ESGLGCELTTVDGRVLLDGVGSLWCNVHGHRHPAIDAAIREQLDKVAHVANLGASNSTTIRLAKRLVDVTPANLNHVFFASDGASAIEVALKMAFQYYRQISPAEPQRTKYISLTRAYHGDTVGTISVGGMHSFYGIFKPLMFDIVTAPSPDCYRAPKGVESEEDARVYYLDQLEQVLQKHHHEVAALVIEPLVQGAAGMITQPKGYLAGVRELTRRYNVLMIADEVAVGFGRTGKLFACDHEQVEPDFICLGKGLTGGYLPMSATLATTEIWNAFLGEFRETKMMYHGHTYGGNPLAAAAAIATLDVFEKEDTLANMQPAIECLTQRLQKLSASPHVGDVRQRGLMAGIELVADKESKTSFDWTEKRGRRVCEHAISNGVWLRPLGDVIVVMPPLVISVEQIHQLCDAIEMGIESVCSS